MNLSKKIMVAVCLSLLSLVYVAPASAQSTDEVILQKMREMEAKLNKVERENRQMRNALRHDSARLAVDEAVTETLSKSSAGFHHDGELHKRSIQIGGELDVTYSYNLNAPDDMTNHMRIFDDEDSNGFNVHAANIYFDGTAKEKGQAGFRIDLGIGTDARKYASWDRYASLTSLYYEEDEDGAIDESALTYVTENNVDRLFDLQEAYIDYIAPVANGIHFSFGKFVTPIGFEVLESAANWNASRSFNFGLMIPFTHTGARAVYQVYDNWTIAGLLVNGADNLQDENQSKMGILQSVWSPVEWFTWTLNGAIGTEGEDNDSDTSYYVNTVMTFDPFETLSFALVGNWGYAENGSLARRNIRDNFLNPGIAEDVLSSDADDAEWYGLAGYVKWQFLENWYVAARGEFINDRNGFRTGLPQTLYSATATVDWAISDPMHIRFEYRHDGSSYNPFSDSQSGPGWKNDANTGGELDTRYPTPGRSGRATQDTLMVQWLYQF